MARCAALRPAAPAMARAASAPAGAVLNTSRPITTLAARRRTPRVSSIKNKERRAEVLSVGTVSHQSCVMDLNTNHGLNTFKQRKKGQSVRTGSTRFSLSC